MIESVSMLEIAIMSKSMIAIRIGRGGKRSVRAPSRERWTDKPKEKASVGVSPARPSAAADQERGNYKKTMY